MPISARVGGASTAVGGGVAAAEKEINNKQTVVINRFIWHLSSHIIQLRKPQQVLCQLSQEIDNSTKYSREVVVRPYFSKIF